MQASTYPATLTKIYDGVTLEWRLVDEKEYGDGYEDGLYQAFNLDGSVFSGTLLGSTKCFGSYDWLMQLESPTAVVGYAIDGFCYCLDCTEQVVDGNDEKRPIIFGDPDWSYGSVPICDSCRREIATIDE